MAALEDVIQGLPALRSLRLNSFLDSYICTARSVAQNVEHSLMARFV